MSNSSKEYIAAAINKGWINGMMNHTIRTVPEYPELKSQLYCVEHLKLYQIIKFINRLFLIQLR